jgi:hypothetical protein
MHALASLCGHHALACIVHTCTGIKHRHALTYLRRESCIGMHRGHLYRSQAYACFGKPMRASCIGMHRTYLHRYQASSCFNMFAQENMKLACISTSSGNKRSMHLHASHASTCIVIPTQVSHASTCIVIPTQVSHASTCIVIPTQVYSVVMLRGCSLGLQCRDTTELVLSAYPHYTNRPRPLWHIRHICTVGKTFAAKCIGCLRCTTQHVRIVPRIVPKAHKTETPRSPLLQLATRSNTFAA